jgi:rhodanese-related sulfurtransferase
VPGAINIPHDELRNRLGELPKGETETVAVYCEVGPRANRAQKVLVEAGYHEVLHLEGGYANWKRRGFPIER